MKNKMKQPLSPFNNRRMLACQAFALPYLKGEGCGNTFLIFDCLDFAADQLSEVMEAAYAILLKEKCDDALILKKDEQNEQKLVLTMIVLEPDRSIAEFCGNGARVVACYLKYKFGCQKRDYYLKTSQGERKIWWDDQGYHVWMGETKMHAPSKFFHPNFVTLTLGLGMKQFHFFWTETLEPHLVTFDEIQEEELYDLGLYLNHQQRAFFPLGINLNKAEILEESRLHVTTFERGVNRITAACGTGATSCAMLAKASGRIKHEHSVHVSLKGGALVIHPREGGAVMSGPATIETWPIA